MRKSRTWLQQHGNSLVLVVGIFLLANGIVGHVNGIHTAMAPDGKYPGKIHQTPVWFLDVIGALAIWFGYASKKHAKRRL